MNQNCRLYVLLAGRDALLSEGECLRRTWCLGLAAV